MITGELYDVSKLLQKRVTDFEIMREDPIVFKAGSSHIVCKPVYYYQHFDFLDDLEKILTKYNYIFSIVDFVSSQDFKKKGTIEKMIAQINIFKTSKEYKKFTQKVLPKFIRKWAFRIKKPILGRNKLVKIKKRQAKKFLRHFSVDEMLEIFFTIFNFNYSLVKKKTFDFLVRLMPEGERRRLNLTSSDSSTKNKVVKMPTYSEKPFPKSTLELMRAQSKMN